MNLLRVIILLLIVNSLSSAQMCWAQGFTRFKNGAADGGQPIQVSPTSGSTPLRVTITGPDLLMTKVRNWNGRPSIGGTGFSISWGDGQRQSRDIYNWTDQNREELFSHTYTAPGTYIISASTYTPGPTDAPIYNWRSWTNVTVGGAATQSCTLQIQEPLGGETFNYQDFPVVRWSMTTDRPVDLHLQLVCGDKVVAEDVVKNIAHNNSNSERRFSPPSFDGYERALREGNTKFRMVLQMIDAQGKTILARSTREFSMTKRYVSSLGGLKQEPLSNDRLAVTLKYKVNHPSCFSYSLDWGDGTKDAAEKYDGQALLKMTEKTFTHRYQRPGVYTVVLHSNNSDPHAKLKDITPYESIIVDLTK